MNEIKKHYVSLLHLLNYNNIKDDFQKSGIIDIVVNTILVNYSERPGFFNQNYKINKEIFKKYIQTNLPNVSFHNTTDHRFLLYNNKMFTKTKFSQLLKNQKEGFATILGFECKGQFPIPFEEVKNTFGIEVIIPNVKNPVEVYTEVCYKNINTVKNKLDKKVSSWNKLLKPIGRTKLSYRTDYISEYTLLKYAYNLNKTKLKSKKVFKFLDNTLWNYHFPSDNFTKNIYKNLYKFHDIACNIIFILLTLNILSLYSNKKFKYDSFNKQLFNLIDYFLNFKQSIPISNPKIKSFISTGNVSQSLLNLLKSNKLNKIYSYTKSHDKISNYMNKFIISVTILLCLFKGSNLNVYDEIISQFLNKKPTLVLSSTTLKQINNITSKTY